jgi:hypothetical protein
VQAPQAITVDASAAAMANKLQKYRRNIGTLPDEHRSAAFR